MLTENTECCFNCAHSDDPWCCISEELTFNRKDPLYAYGKWPGDCHEYKMAEWWEQKMRIVNAEH